MVGFNSEFELMSNYSGSATMVLEEKHSYQPLEGGIIWQLGQQVRAGGGEEAGGEDEGEDRPRLSPMCGSK